MLARISLRERGKKGGLRSARCYEANGTYTAGDNDGGDNINIIMGQRRGDVTFGPLRPEDTARARARDRADTGDEICPIRAKTRVKARATLMDVKTNYESGR